MTRARDLSKLLGTNSNGVIPNSNLAVDLTNLSATNLTSGTVNSSRLALVANDIPNLDTAKITSGTFADARISQSSVSQHATSFDDSKLQQDIMVLALQQATDANRSAYNLSNSFVEQFEDSTGIDVQTNTARNSNEYVSSITENIGGSLINLYDSDMTVDSFGGSVIGGQSTLFDGQLNPTPGQNGTYMDMSSLGASQSTLSPTTYISFTLNNTHKIYNLRCHSWNTNGRIATCKFLYSTDGSTWNYWNVNGSENASGTSSSSSVITWVNNNAWGQHTDNSSGTVMKYIKLVPLSAYNNGNYNGGISELELKGYTYSLNANATGNFTSVSQTAPATVSKMGIVVLYKNNYGTATLNTDLVAQVSANNGTDYTTVTLTPRGTFATGINIAVANNVTVTSGTSVKYKISFANQSSGSKDTQVHGVGLIY